MTKGRVPKKKRQIIHFLWISVFPPPTMAHIIALPYPKSLIDLSTGKLMLNSFLLMDWNKKLYICLFLNLVFKHKQML